jgi:hypothetical protein
MRQPSRRAFLAVTGLAVTSAGCLGREADQSESTTGTDRQPSAAAESSTAVSLGTEQSVGGVSVTVSALTVQDSALTLDDDTMTLHTADDERYVVVSVSGSEAGPAPGAFSLDVDGETYPGRVDLFGRDAQLDERGPVYDPSYGIEQGWVGFAVPPGLDAGEARIALSHGDETASWRLEAAQFDALRQPKAEFELRSVEIPGTLLLYDPVSVRVVAENVSDVAGVFKGVLNVAGLNFAYAPYPFALDAAPGETVVWEQTFRDGPSRDVESVGFFLETVAGGTEVRATVRGRNEPAQGPATTTETTTTTATETTTTTAAETTTTTAAETTTVADAATPPTTDS